MTTPDFSKVWSVNSPLHPYTFTDADYLTGWKFIGSAPPAREMMDTWMRTADEKMSYLNQNLFSPSALASYLFWRLPSTQYVVGDKRTLKNGPVDTYIECVTAGLTSADALESLPSGTKAGGTFTDGTAVWHVMQFADSENAGINLLKRSQAYVIGDIAYCAALPTWARLTCTVAGTTGEAEPAWGAVTEGGTVTDGTVTWLICDVKHALYA